MKQTLPAEQLAEFDALPLRDRARLLYEDKFGSTPDPDLVPAGPVGSDAWAQAILDQIATGKPFEYPPGVYT